VTTTLRRPTVILATGLMAAVLVGCTGSAKPQTTASPTGSAPTTLSPTDSHALGLRYGDAPALLVQCGLSSGAIKPQTGQPWYSDGKVLPLSGNGAGSRGAEFSTWFDAHSSIVIAGQPLSYWQQWAADHDALPTQVCGTTVSASGLQAKIDPGQPNPWTG
jgi:hypothetical protein